MLAVPCEVSLAIVEHGGELEGEGERRLRR